MIASLRTKHPRIILATGLIAGTLFLVAMWSRPIPIRTDSPLANPSPLPHGTRLIDGEMRWTGFPIQTWLIDTQSGLRLFLKTSPDIQVPDLLLYNSHQRNILGALPEDAVLIGALSPGHRQGFNLDDTAGATYILYSLARQTVVNQVRLPEGTRP